MDLSRGGHCLVRRSKGGRISQPISRDKKTDTWDLGRAARRDFHENVKWIRFFALARNQVKENRKREFSIAETDKYHAEDIASSDKEAERKQKRNAHCRG